MWLQWTDNEDALRELNHYIQTENKTHLEKASQYDDTYTPPDGFSMNGSDVIDGDTVLNVETRLTEFQVDTLCEHASTENDPHEKVKGLMTVPLIKGKKAHDWATCSKDVYICRIKLLFASCKGKEMKWA